MKDLILLNETEDEHLEEVKTEMAELGSPKIHAVNAPQWGAWVALEGSHRITAASELGIEIEIIEVEYSEDVYLSDFGADDEDDYSVAEIFDSAWERGNLIVEVGTI